MGIEGRLKDNPGMTTDQRSISLCNLRVPQTLAKEPAPRIVMEAQSCALGLHGGTAIVCQLGRKGKVQLQGTWKLQLNKCSTEESQMLGSSETPEHGVLDS